MEREDDRVRARVVAVTNQKGGVGKTTTTINLAASLALADQKVLLVDVDPQANLTSGVGLRGQSGAGGTIYDALTSGHAESRSTRGVHPAHRGRRPLRHSCRPEPHRRGDRARRRCRNASSGCAACSRRCGTQFDSIFIDCPPSLGLLTLNALVAADAVLIPLHCEYFALEGLADLVATMRRVRASLNPSLDIEGVLLTMNDERTNLGATGRPRRARVLQGKGVRHRRSRATCASREAPSHGKPVVLYDAKSRGAEAYVALAREVLARNAPPGLRRKPATDQRKIAARSYRVPVNAQRLRDQHGPNATNGALGKGLSALIPDAPEPTPSRVTRARHGSASRPTSYQPRARDGRRAPGGARAIDQGQRRHSADRRAHAPTATRYQIIAGERRWRAAQQAGLRACRWSSASRERPRAQRLLEMALIENIQREDLNPIEEAAAYRRLADEFHLTQDDIAAAVGKDRATIANMLRLLKLPDEVREEVAAGRLSMGHARAMLALTDEAEQRTPGAGDHRARVCRCARPKALVKKVDRTRTGACRERTTARRRRAHARRGREAAASAGHARPHHSSRKEGTHRDRVLERRGADPDLRGAGRQLTGARMTADTRRHMTAEATDRTGRLRRLSEQTRRRRARSGVERPATQTDPRVLVDFRTADDAGVYTWEGGPALVQTVDFFTPIVDDPFIYGQIAAANSLSDMYAMGGRPVTALAIAGFPEEELDTETIRQIFLGGFDKLREAGVALLGGHTVRDPEMKFGYAVTGAVDPDRMLANAGARAGDILILTKPLGTGIVGTAIKFDARRPAPIARAAIASMTTLNAARGAGPVAVRARRSRVHRHHRLWPDRPRDRDGRRRAVSRSRSILRPADIRRRPRDGGNEPIRRHGIQPRALRGRDVNRYAWSTARRQISVRSPDVRGADGGHRAAAANRVRLRWPMRV